MEAEICWLFIAHAVLTRCKRWRIPRSSATDNNAKIPVTLLAFRLPRVRLFLSLSVSLLVRLFIMSTECLVMRNELPFSVRSLELQRRLIQSRIPAALCGSCMIASRKAAHAAEKRRRLNFLQRLVVKFISKALRMARVKGIT